ncbi:MAG: hypothetical protein LUC36_07735 [Oscillospiraceae bacterium]|nr:hypothetical protein [Oscillospiraceae bacterium]
MRASRVALITVTILVIALAAILAAQLFPYQSGTAEVALPTPSASGSASDSESGGGVDFITVTTENVQAVLEGLERAENYSRVLSVERFWSGGSLSTQISVWERDGDVRLIEAASPEKNILISDGTVYIWYSDDLEALFTGTAAERDADEYQTILTYEDILDLDPGAVTDGGYTDWSGEYCIYAEYIHPDTGYTCRVYVSPTTGLLMGSEIYDGSSLVYFMSSSAADTAIPDDEYFRIPVPPEVT